MELKQQLRLSQNLVMTPQLQQAIKLLQLSRLELIDSVREEMMENPILEDSADIPEMEKRATEQAETTSIDQLAAMEERAGNVSSSPEERAATKESHEEEYWEKFLDAYSNQTPLPTTGRMSSDDMPTLEQTLSGRTSLSEHLESQIRLSNFREDESRFGLLVAHNLDENGYLTLRGVASVEGEEEPTEGGNVIIREGEDGPRALSLEDLATEAGLELEDAEEVLRIIQSMDPVGIASRDLRECLLVQAEHFGYEEENIVWQVIDRHLHNLEKRNFGAIVRDLKCELEEVYEAAKLISTLEPRPGRNFSTEDPPYISPDVYVHKVGDEYVVTTNEDGLPKLKINEQQARSLMKDPKARDFVTKKLASAKWFVRSLDQRHKTIVKVTRCIVDKQHDFFEKGIEFLRPMILRDVAETVEMHESTISRVTTNKYVHTPRGIFELKYFFNSSIRRIAEEDIASESVKQAIKKIIAEEDTKNPFSDEQIVKRLESHKIVIARRTVAKYREMLGILSSAKRKHYF